MVCTRLAMADSKRWTRGASALNANSASMRLASTLPLTLLSLPSVWAQLSLPDLPWTPPDASNGTQSANDTTPNSQWSTLVGDLLYFYDEQRSGKLPSSERVPWRNSSALDDGKDVGLDLSGGYYDAGGELSSSFKCVELSKHV